MFIQRLSAQRIHTFLREIALKMPIFLNIFSMRKCFYNLLKKDRIICIRNFLWEMPRLPVVR